MQETLRSIIVTLVAFLGGVTLGMLAARLVWFGWRALEALPRDVLVGLVLLAAVCTGYGVKLNGASGGPGPSRTRAAGDSPTSTEVRETGRDASAVPVLVPDVVDAALPTLSTNALEDCDLCFGSVDVASSDVTLGLAWPAGTAFANGRLDIFACADIAEADWCRIASVDISDARSNAVVTVSASLLTGLGDSNAAFFDVASQDDSDGDGYSDAYERHVLKTNPNASDSDGDGLADNYELAVGLDPTAKDTDGDGLDDGSEQAAGTDPLARDSDGDGLLDSTEVLHTHTNPLEADSDGDGVSDGQAFARGLDRSSQDSASGFPRMETVRIVPDGIAGDSFETQGTYSVSIAYTGETSDGFSVLGIAPPGGTAVRPDVCYDVSGPGHRNAFSLSASGVTFRPLKTGWFEFQVEADDEASLRVGDLAATAQWGVDNPGQVARAVFVAGRAYPVRVTSGNGGGPAKLAIPRFGVYSPIERPTLSAGLSRDTMIYEDRFEDAPGVWIGPPQPSNVYALEVSGGHFGGTLTISGNGMAALEKVSGTRPPGTCTVGPGETHTWTGGYWARQPSAALDDKEIIATFVENETGETLSLTSRFTSVRLELTCVYAAPRNPCPHRHVVGVGEKVVFGLTPALEPVVLEAASLNDGDLYGYHNSFGNTTIPGNDRDRTYVCPASATQMPQVTVSFRGQEYHPQIVLLEPESVECRKASWDGSCFLRGEVGAGSLVTRNYIKPYNVSFQGILVAEIPCDSVIPGTGYFASPPPSVSLSHKGDANPLWQAQRIGEGNYWTVDYAGRGQPYPNWSAGRMDWKIPIGWLRCRYDDELARSDITRPDDEGGRNYSQRSWLIGGRDDAYLQTFEIDSDGGSSISKHAHTLFRSRNCKVKLDGKILQWFH